MGISVMAAVAAGSARPRSNLKTRRGKSVGVSQWQSKEVEQVVRENGHLRVRIRDAGPKVGWQNFRHVGNAHVPERLG